MASKRKSVKNLKAKKVSSKKAQQVKGGLLPAVRTIGGIKGTNPSGGLLDINAIYKVKY